MKREGEKEVSVNINQVVDQKEKYRTRNTYYTPTNNSDSRVNTVANVKKMTKGLSRGNKIELSPGTD